MINFADKFFPAGVVTSEDIALFRAHTKKLSFRKGEVVLSSGEECVFIYYVIRGCLRQFVVDDRGKEHILNFAPEDWMCGDHESLVRNIPSTTSIDAIEESEVYAVPKHLVYELHKTNLQLLAHHNNALRSANFDLQKRLVQLLSASAEMRYLTFIKTYPKLANRLPLKMIASYLGITPESLSRVRHVLVKRPSPEAGKPPQPDIF
jgi:CRP-like cAMP-binding protein